MSHKRKYMMLGDVVVLLTVSMPVAAETASVEYTCGVELAPEASLLHGQARDAISELPSDQCTDTSRKADRDIARALAQCGYEAHKQLDYRRAARIYQTELQYWNHPDGHFRLASAQFALVRFQEAYQHLNTALSCQQSMKSRWSDRARAMKKRIEREFAVLAIENDDPEIRISLDGVALPGRGAGVRVVHPGQYTIVAEKPGHVSVERSIVLERGGNVVITPGPLVSLAQATRTEYRWSPKVPRAVIPAGAFVALAGGTLMSLARARELPAEDSSSPATKPLFSSKDTVHPKARWMDRSAAYEMVANRKARWMNRLAVGGMVVGGTAMAVGITMGLLNRSRTHIDESAGSSRRIGVDVSPGYAGVSTRLEF